MSSSDTESSLFDLLGRRYKAPEWALFGGVRNRAGFDATRTADALAMSLWPSRGLRLHGFEIKCSRSDWLTELKDPTKAEAFSVYCDHWWLVTAPGVVDGDLPPTWGHLERRGARPVCRVEAPAQKPKHLPRTMLAAMCKRIVTTDEADLVKARQEGYGAGVKEGERSASYKLEAFQKLSEQVNEFERTSGVKVRHGWQHGKIGEAVRAVLEADASESLRRQRNVLARATEALDAALAELDQPTWHRVEAESSSDPRGER